MSDMRDAAAQVKSFESMTGRRMALHEREAMILSEAGKLGEQRQLDLGVDYSDQHVRLSAVHARQDLVLIVSYLNSLAQSFIFLEKTAKFPRVAPRFLSSRRCGDEF